MMVVKWDVATDQRRKAPIARPVVGRLLFLKKSFNTDAKLHILTMFGYAIQWMNIFLSMSVAYSNFTPLPLSQAAIVRRSVLVVRHGERVDQIFGKSWLQQCSTPDGE